MVTTNFSEKPGKPGNVGEFYIQPGKPETLREFEFESKIYQDRYNIFSLSHAQKYILMDK